MFLFGTETRRTNGARQLRRLGRDWNLCGSKSGSGIVTHTNSSGNTIGGTAAVQGTSFPETRIAVSLLGTSNNTVLGNTIGLNVAGAAYGNAIRHRVECNGNTIGGTIATARNVISGNQYDGLRIYFSNNNIVLGNYIGTNATGTAGVGNQRHGVSIGYNSNNNIIGGTLADRPT